MYVLSSRSTLCRGLAQVPLAFVFRRFSHYFGLGCVVFGVALAVFLPVAGDRISTEVAQPAQLFAILSVTMGFILGWADRRSGPLPQSRREARRARQARRESSESAPPNTRLR